MSILSMLNKTTLGIGLKTPDTYTSRAQRRGLKSGQELTAAAEQGYAFRNPALGSEKYTDTVVRTPEINTLLQAPTSNYQQSMFNSMLAGTNRLVDNDAKTYAFRPGNFSRNLTSYTEKLFNDQVASAGRATQPTSLVAATTQTKLIITPIASNIGTGPGMPFDDGRYIPTFGYGFVEYGTLANGGYA